MSWQMQPQQMQQMPQQMQSMQQQMQHQQQMQNPQQHQQMHNQQMPQQMQHQQMQPPQMQQQMQGSKGGKGTQPGSKGGKGMMQRPPVQNQVRPQTPTHQTPASPAGGQTIVVSGCANATVSNLIKGSFSVSGVNHGKPTYKKDMSPPNVTVLIYFWDDRDGPTFSGWWIGPKVGGDQVWSHADNRTSPTPPPAGWHVPWDGPVDPTLKLTYSTAAPPLPAPAAPNAGPPPRSQGGKGQVVGARPPLKPPGVELAKNLGQEAPPNHRLKEQKRRAAEAEEIQRKRQEEMKRHREEEAQRRKEMAAATSVRKVLAKVRAARPDSYDSLRVQLEESIAANLEAMGSMVSKVGQEAEEVLQATQSRIDEINEQRAEEERKRSEEEKRRRHEAENSAQFVEQAKADAQTQQSKLQEAEEMCKQLEDEGDPAKLLEQAEAAEKQINSVRDEASSVKSSIYEKQRALGDMIGSKVRRELGEILAQLSTGIRSLDGTLHSVKRRREKVAGKAAAARKINDKKSTFAKFDVDRDGKLNKKEVEAYMKATINFDLPSAILDQIVKKLDPISFAKFRSLHQRLYIAKSELLAREARAAEAAKQIELEEKAQALMSVIHGADASLQEAEAALVEAERKRSLLRSMDASIDDIEEGVRRLDSLTKSADEAFSSSHGKIEEAQKLRVGDMQTRGEPQLLRLIHREKHGKERLQRLEDLLKDLQEKAKRKTLTEMDQKKSEVVLALWKKISEDTTTVPQLFETMNGGGSISREKFNELLRGLSDVELTDAERDKLFTYVAGESASMTKEIFMEMMKLYYTCIKSTVMSEELSIKSKQVRRLELGAVLEALEGPRNEDVAKLVRLRCRASDGTEGWVTYKGNQGTTFLEPGGQKYVCLQATEITEALDVSSTSIRMLAEGELIEVTEFEKKDGDATRIKGKAKSDGAHGWITISSPNITFLQPS